MVKVKSLVIPAVLTFAVPRTIFAAEPISNFYAPAEKLGGSSATIGAFISPLIQDALILTGLGVFAVLLIGGFNFISSGGDKAKVQQATNMLTYGLVGLVLAVTALAITQIIGRIGGFNFFGPGI